MVTQYGLWVQPSPVSHASHASKEESCQSTITRSRLVKAAAVPNMWFNFAPACSLRPTTLTSATLQYRGTLGREQKTVSNQAAMLAKALKRELRVAARLCGPLAQSMAKRPGTRRKRQRRVAADTTVRAPVNSIVI